MPDKINSPGQGPFSEGAPRALHVHLPGPKPKSPDVLAKQLSVATAAGTGGVYVQREMKADKEKKVQALNTGSCELYEQTLPTDIIVGKMVRAGCSEHDIKQAFKDAGLILDVNFYELKEHSLVPRDLNRWERQDPVLTTEYQTDKVEDQTLLVPISQQSESPTSQNTREVNQVMLTPAAQTLQRRQGPDPFASISPNSKVLSQSIGVPITRSIKKIDHKVGSLSGAYHIIGLVSYTVLGAIIGWLVGQYLSHSNQKTTNYGSFDQSHCDKKPLNLQLNQQNVKAFLSFLELVDDYKLNKISEVTLKESLKNYFNFTDQEIEIFIKEC